MRVSLSLALLFAVAACDGPPAAAPSAAAPSASSAPVVALPPAPAASADAAAPAPPPAPAPVAALPKVVLIAPGAEPRSARTYALVVGQTDRRALTVRQTASIAGKPAQDAAFGATIEITPRAVKDGTASIEVKVLKVELLGVTDPKLKAAAEADLAPLSGLLGTFDLTARGDASPIIFAPNGRPSGGGMQAMEDGLGQAFEQLFPPFPEEPIGVGARWSRTTVDTTHGAQSRVAVTFTLATVAPDGGTVNAEVDIAIPKHALTEPGVPAGSTNEVTGKGKYAYVLKRDHVTSKMSGEMVITRRVDLAADGAGKAGRTMSEVITLKNTLDAAK